MEQILSDFRFGFRQLLKHPVIAFIAVLALGLGISSVTTQMSVVNGLFFKGLPFPESDRIAHLERINIKQDNFNAEVPILELIEWQRQQDAFEGLAGFYVGTANLTLDETVERYSGAFISANAFDLLQVEAAMGRTLDPADDLAESPDVIVLSNKIWKRDLGQDPDIIGKTAILNGRSVTIVGVMPDGFSFPVNEDLWVPLLKQQKPSTLSWADDSMSLDVFGRMKEGVNFDGARSSMTLVARNIENAHPDTNEGFRDIQVQPFIDEFLGDQTSAMTAIMLLITVLILIIACANVANLLLARSMRRQKEIAIRSALGATRSRIIYQFLAESILLAILGAGLGLVLSYLSIKDIKESMVEMNSPFWMDFSLDWKVLLAATVVTILTGILSGIFPAFRASRLNEAEILKDETRTSTSVSMGLFSKALVIIQISVAAVILTLVILFIKSVNNATSMEYEYDPDSAITTRIGLFEEAYPDEQARANFVNALLEQLRARPEIDLATTSHRYQFLETPGVPYKILGRVYESDRDREFARYQNVSMDFFKTMKLPILDGREFRQVDHLVEYPRCAIVNKAFAEREWPGQSAIGKRFQPDLSITGVDENDLPFVEIVGVVPSMNESGVFRDADDDQAAFFIPQTATAMSRFITIIARGRGQPADLVPILREEVGKLDQNLPLYAVGTARQLNEQNTVQFRFFSSIFKRFGILAAFLAAVGIYGVITFTVNQRITEFGIRQALGATRSAIFKLVYRHAFKQLALGFLIALALLSPMILSTGLKESMALFFYEIDHDSLSPYLMSFGFVAAISILAATPPATRAARTDPAEALRYE